jgi:hypothetical protein
MDQLIEQDTREFFMSFLRLHVRAEIFCLSLVPEIFWQLVYLCSPKSLSSLNHDFYLKEFRGTFLGLFYLEVM